MKQTNAVKRITWVFTTVQGMKHGYISNLFLHINNVLFILCIQSSPNQENKPSKIEIMRYTVISSIIQKINEVLRLKINKIFLDRLNCYITLDLWLLI